MASVSSTSEWVCWSSIGKSSEWSTLLSCTLACSSPTVLLASLSSLESLTIILWAACGLLETYFRKAVLSTWVTTTSVLARAPALLGAPSISAISISCTYKGHCFIRSLCCPCPTTSPFSRTRIQSKSSTNLRSFVAITSVFPAPILSKFFLRYTCACLSKLVMVSSSSSKLGELASALASAIVNLCACDRLLPVISRGVAKPSERSLAIFFRPDISRTSSNSVPLILGLTRLIFSSMVPEKNVGKLSTNATWCL